jgi:regulator of protease activity HflC (stomatin/prohibitin superfamily)
MLFSRVVRYRRGIRINGYSTDSLEALTEAFTRQFSSGVDYSKYVLASRKACFGFNIVKKGETGFIERFGKLNRNAEQGLNLTVPLIESIRRVTIREISVPIDPQSSVTKDNVQVMIAGAVYFKVSDPLKACYGTYDLLMAVVTHAQSSMRSAVGLIDLDTLFHDRSALNKAILESMQGAAKEWGVDILRYEITEVTPDKHVSQAMDSQSIAERKRRETALNADAQRQQDITVSDGKKQAVINEALAQQQKIILEAEGNKRRTVLAAEGDKESKLLAAEAEATAIAKIGEALTAHPNTAQYLLAKNYMENVAKMLPKGTVFLPKDIGNISTLVATATAINGELNQSIKGE